MTCMTYDYDVILRVLRFFGKKGSRSHTGTHLRIANRGTGDTLLFLAGTCAKVLCLQPGTSTTAYDVDLATVLGPIDRRPAFSVNVRRASSPPLPCNPFVEDIL
jgi:hypothetical protein